jgi:hypothetical protein
VWRLADERRGGSSRLSLWRRTGGGQAPDERKGRSLWPYLFLVAADRRRPNERRGRGGLLFSIWRSMVGRALGATGASPRGGVGRKGRRRRTAWPHAEGVAADLVEPVRSLPDRARDLSFVVSPLPKSPLTTSRLRPIAPSAFSPGLLAPPPPRPPPPPITSGSTRSYWTADIDICGIPVIDVSSLKATDCRLTFMASRSWTLLLLHQMSIYNIRKMGEI